MIPLQALDRLLALGTVVLQLLALAFLALYFLRKKFPDLHDVSDMLGKWGLWIGFVLTLGATAMSLYFSEVLGFAPCSLCWLQRIFLYPQVILFAIAAIKNDRRIADYIIGLSIPGAIVALYQHYLQMGGTEAIPCPVNLADATDCAQRFFFEFGYITFPLMCFSLFAFTIVMMLFVRKK